MTDTLKTVLVNALEDASIQGDHAELNPWGEDQEVIWITPGHHREEVIVDADRLATAIRDHVLNRERMMELVSEIMAATAHDDNYWLGLDGSHAWWADRLIEGLTR